MSFPPPPPGPGPFVPSPGGGSGGYAQSTGESWIKGGNDKATTAIILACVGLLCCGLLQIPALIFGIQALKLADERGGDGRGKAIVAIALSGTFLALWVVFGGLALLSAASGQTR